MKWRTLLGYALLPWLAAYAAVPAQTAQSAGVGDAARRAATMHAQPGDRIAVAVLREPGLSGTVMVNERGEAAFAKLGVLKVDTFTIADLQDTLREQYSRYLRNPALEIVVLRRVAVYGEVNDPDVYLVDVSTTLRDVIAKAGGVSESGNRKKVYIVRDEHRTHVPNWESEQGIAGDLRSGDQVVVGRKSWLVMNALPTITMLVVAASLIVSSQR